MLMMWAVSAYRSATVAMPAVLGTEATIGATDGMGGGRREMDGECPLFQRVIE
jgi:hypothetical protein